MNTPRRPSEDRNRRKNEILDVDGLSSLSSPRRIIAVIFLVFLGLAAAGAGFYLSQWRQFSRSAESELSTVARLKVDQISAWREDQIEDAALLAEYPPFVHALEMIVAGRKDDLAGRLTTLLTFYQRNNDLNEIVLMDMDGRVRLSLNGGKGGVYSDYEIAMAEALRSGRPVITELHSGVHHSQPHVSVLAPVFSGVNRVPIGVVVLVNDARRFLYPLLRSWPTLSRSAETYLLMREGSDALFLNDVRHGKDTALKLRIPLSRSDVSAAKAVTGGQGVFRARDYRGVDVMSAVMRVPGSSWYLLAEIDAKEVYEEWNHRSLLFLVLFLLLAGFLAALGHAYWQRDRKARFQALYLAEAHLNATIERHAIILRAIADAVISTDRDDRVELMNPVAEEMTGWSSEEAEGKTLSEVFRIAGAETRAETNHPLNGTAKEKASAGYDGNGLLITREGREVPIAVSSAPIRDDQGEVSGVVLAFRDRTGERNAQRLQSVRLELLEYQVTHSLDDFLARALDLIGGMVDSPAGFYHFAGPDQRTLFFRQGSSSFIKGARGAGGLETGYSIGRQDMWEDAVRSGKAEVRNDRRQAPGKEEAPEARVDFIRHLAVPIVRDGAVKAVLGVGNKPSEYLDRDVEIVSHLADLTWEIIERKRAEEEQERLRAQLDQARKMESVGRLAGGVAHDFNNMLGVILGHAELALMKLDHTHPLHSHLSAILKATERSADLTRQLLAFARKQTILPRTLNLNETVEGMLVMLERLIGEDIRLVWHSGEGVWTVKMDPSQLDQILTNLCVNARDAISGVGKIMIETSNVIFDEEYRAVDSEFLPGEFVMLAVSDDGGGMDRDTMEKIFDPFFTTKGVGEGTGLGLATVYGIVKQNNGFIKVYSEPGLGATFRIFLPRHEAASVECGGAVPEPLKRGHETILLVEDEAAILEIGRVMLESLGYSVLAALTPADAIRLAEERRGMIDLLLTDVIMPEMNGRELAKILLSLYPDLACLFMSGYTADVIAHRGVLDDGVNFIQKPFTSRGLSMAVRLALEKEDPVSTSTM